MKNIFLLLLLIASFSVNSQEKDKILPKANEEFVAKNYSEAEANYRISQSKATNKTVASYNLGNSIYRQNQAGEAKYAYTKALEKAKTYTEKRLFPFFEGLIPEGWLLDIASKNWKINPNDRMGLLLACCQNCIGAVSIKPIPNENE